MMSMIKFALPPGFAIWVFSAELFGGLGAIGLDEIEKVLVISAIATLFSGFLVVAYYINALNAARIALEVSQATTRDWKEQHDLEYQKNVTCQETIQKLQAHIAILESRPDMDLLYQRLLSIETKIESLAADSHSRLVGKDKPTRGER